MLTSLPSRTFKRDVKRLERRGKDLKKLRNLLLLLIEERQLPQNYRDHPLKGDWSGYRGAHIEPDWLIIYRILGGELQHGNAFRSLR